MSASAIVGALRVVLGLESASFTDGLTDAQVKLRAFDAKAKAIGAGMAKFGAGISVVGAGLAAAIKGQLNVADDMSKAASKFGVPIESLSRLNYAADLSGVSTEALGTSMSKLSRSMAEALKGGAAAKTFAGLGVKVKDATGALRSADDVMADLSDVFAKMPDGAEKTALAMQLFGKAGADMIPMLNMGADEMRRLGVEAAAMGLVVDAKTGKAAEAFNDNLSRLTGTVRGLVMQVAAALAPALERVSELAVDLARWFQDLSPTAQQVLAGFAAFTVVLGPLAIGLGAVVSSLGTVIGVFRALALAVVSNPVVAVIAAIAAGAYLIYQNWEPIKAFFSNLWEGIKVAASDAWDGIKGAAASAWEGTKAVFSGVGAWFGAQWESVKTKTSLAWENIKSAVGSAIEGLKQIFLNYHPLGLLYQNWDGVTAWSSNLWDGVKASVRSAVDVLKTILIDYQPAVLLYRHWDEIDAWFGTKLGELPAVFTAAWESISAVTTQWVSDFLAIGGQIVDGLKAGIQAKWDEMVAWFNGLADGLTADFKGWLGIKSPSRVFREIGQFITQGLGLGLQDGIPQVETAMSQVSDAVGGKDVTQGLYKFRDTAREVFSQVAFQGKKLGDVLRNMASSWLSSTASSMFTSGFNGLWGALGLPSFANGTNNFAGGLARVNERGGEIMNLPSGTQIIPHDVSKRMADRSGGGAVEIIIRQEPGTVAEIARNEAGAMVRMGIEQYDRQVVRSRVHEALADGRRKS